MMKLKTIQTALLTACLTAGLLTISNPSDMPPVFAQEQNATGAGEAATSSATTEELRRRIERVVEERREQIAGVIDNILSEKAGYIGEITRISEEAITVRTLDDSPIIIPITEDLVILEDTTPITVDSIEVGNWATVMGNQTNETLEPEYVVVSEDTLAPSGQLVVLGSIVSIDRNEVVIVTRGTGEERTFVISTSTEFQDVDGEEALRTDFIEDLNILITALEGADDWEVETVRSLAPLSEMSE